MIRQYTGPQSIKQSRWPTRIRSVPAYRCHNCHNEFEQPAQRILYVEARSTDAPLAAEKHRNFLLGLIVERIEGEVLRLYWDRRKRLFSQAGGE